MFTSLYLKFNYLFKNYNKDQNRFRVSQCHYEAVYHQNTDEEKVFLTYLSWEVWLNDI